MQTIQSTFYLYFLSIYKENIKKRDFSFVKLVEGISGGTYCAAMLATLGDGPEAARTPLEWLKKRT